MLWQNIVVWVTVAGAAFYVVAKFAGWSLPSRKPRSDGPVIRAKDLVRRGKGSVRPPDCH